MSDRELLELAAKAIGARPYTDRIWPGLCLSDDDECDPFYVNRHGSNAKNWNSIEKDGDALQLAVDCGIGMRFHDGWGEVFHPAVGCLPFKYEYDKRKATRYAISMVAAEIGKAMQ